MANLTPALVGTAGAVSTSASGAAVTPAWGAGANRTAGNLLVLQVSVTGSSTAIATPSGWTSAVQRVGTTCIPAVFYRTATGADAAPTLAAITSSIINARLLEFSGAAGPGVGISSSGGAAGTTSPLTASEAAVDTSVPSLMVCSTVVLNSAARTLATCTDTYTNGTAIAVNNAGTSTASHYDFSYSNTTSNAVTNKNQFAFTTTQITGVAVALVSFNPIAAEDSPALELSSFGTFSGIGSGDTINAVTVQVNQYGTGGMLAPTYQLWDGTTAQIGATQTGSASTSTTNFDVLTFTGVSYSQLATLRLRVLGHGPSPSFLNVDAVSMQVNYTPAAAPAYDPTEMGAMGMRQAVHRAAHY